MLNAECRWCVENSPLNNCYVRVYISICSSIVVVVVAAVCFEFVVHVYTNRRLDGTDDVNTCNRYIQLFLRFILR